jgi:hypothetical protein
MLKPFFGTSNAPHPLTTPAHQQAYPTDRGDLKSAAHIGRFRLNACRLNPRISTKTSTPKMAVVELRTGTTLVFAAGINRRCSRIENE